MHPLGLADYVSYCRDGLGRQSDGQRARIGMGGDAQTRIAEHLPATTTTLPPLDFFVYSAEQASSLSRKHILATLRQFHARKGVVWRTGGFLPLMPLPPGPPLALAFWLVSATVCEGKGSRSARAKTGNHVKHHRRSCHSGGPGRSVVEAAGHAHTSGRNY